MIIREEEDREEPNVGIKTITSEDDTNGTSLESDTSPENTEVEDTLLTEDECMLTTESITTEWLTTIRENTLVR